MGVRWVHGGWGWGGSMGVEHGGWGWDGSIGVGAAVGAWLVGCIGCLLSMVCMMDYGDLVSILGQKIDTLNVYRASSMLHIECIQINEDGLFMSLHNGCLVNSQTWSCNLVSSQQLHGSGGNGDMASTGNRKIDQSVTQGTSSQEGR